MYANRNPYSSQPYQPSTASPKHDLLSSRGSSKVVYPIPVTRSATESLGVHKPTSSLSSYCRDNRLASDAAPPNNHFEHTAEFYSKDDCADENNDYYYSTSYSFSTIF